MSKFNYSLTPVNDEITGGEQIWRATIQTNESITPETLAKRLATRMKQDEALSLYFVKAFSDIIDEEILAGNRVNVGNMLTGFAIKGSFQSEDAVWDSARHTLVPTVRALDPLKSALTAITPENLQQCLTCSVYSLMDTVTKETNCITGTDVVHIQGSNIGIDTDNADEGVTLVDGNGVVQATATVTESDTQTIACSFPTPPAAGVYTLMVACRNGNRVSLAPAIGRLNNVVVKAA